MNHRISYPLVATLFAGAAFAVHAEDDSPEPAGWHFRFGAHVQFNYRVSIHDAQVPPSTVAGQFDNGYVKTDVTGSTNSTSYWGYSDLSSSNANGTISLSRFDNVPRAADISGKNSTAMGGEVSAAYELSTFRIWKKREAHVGFEVGYGFSTFDVSGSSSSAATVQQVIGTYSLVDGPPLPSAPYAGAYSTRGALLNFIPDSLTTNSFTGVQNTFTAKTSVDLSAFKLGPWIDLPLTSKLNLHVGAGYCAVFAQAEIDANDTLTGVALGPNRQPPGAYHAAKRNWEPGLYGQVRLEYEFSDRWGAYLGADFQHNNNLSFETAGRKFDVQMGSAFGASAGVRFSF